jgi:hypothetical protein
MRITYLFIITFLLISCDPKALEKILEVPLSNAEVAKALKDALNMGVDESVDYLSSVDGYYQSPYKILLPEEARNVTDRLKIVPGFSNLEEEVVKRINRAAEDAAKKAGPIFLNAITSISFEDAMGILMGEKDAATEYLHKATYDALYAEFKPVLINSLNTYNALDYWEKAIKQYNSIPFISKVNPDLADHVAGKALVGLFDLIEKKELGIRTDISQRTTALLQKVFAKQDS